MSSRTDRRRRRGKCAIGVATVEALVALPVLVLLFIGAHYLADLTRATSDTRTQARMCAWLYSANNCQTDDSGNPTGVPQECVKVLSQKSAVTWDSPELRSAGSTLTGGAVGGFVKRILQPVLDAVFGDAASAHVERAVHRPLVFGGSTTAIAGNYRIACNVSETTLGSAAKDAWQSIMGDFP